MSTRFCDDCRASYRSVTEEGHESGCPVCEERDEAAMAKARTSLEQLTGAVNRGAPRKWQTKWGGSGRTLHDTELDTPFHAEVLLRFNVCLDATPEEIKRDLAEELMALAASLVYTTEADTWAKATQMAADAVESVAARERESKKAS